MVNEPVRKFNEPLLVLALADGNFLPLDGIPYEIVSKEFPVFIQRTLGTVEMGDIQRELRIAGGRNNTNFDMIVTIKEDKGIYAIIGLPLDPQLFAGADETAVRIRNWIRSYEDRR